MPTCIPHGLPKSHTTNHIKIVVLIQELSGDTCIFYTEDVQKVRMATSSLQTPKQVGSKKKHAGICLDFLAHLKL